MFRRPVLVQNRPAPASIATAFGEDEEGFYPRGFVLFATARVSRNPPAQEPPQLFRHRRRCCQRVWNRKAARGVPVGESSSTFLLRVNTGRYLMNNSCRHALDLKFFVLLLLLLLSLLPLLVSSSSTLTVVLSEASHALFGINRNRCFLLADCPFLAACSGDPYWCKTAPLPQALPPPSVRTKKAFIHEDSFCLLLLVFRETLLRRNPRSCFGTGDGAAKGFGIARPPVVSPSASPAAPSSFA
mmetsp:Transcript_115872/g.236891  ORF Transcript_115872/g.236891 Transcript_115872/m.236891 type:complete len:243 (-) Transcript_115872:128-856(-)